MCKQNISIRANAVQFNRQRGLGKIVIRGKFETLQGVDDPVIEIWNAVQKERQEVYKELGLNLIHFTILFPSYNKENDTTVYSLVPVNNVGSKTCEFLNRASFTLTHYYKDRFVDSFRQFIIGKNALCKENVYAIYKDGIDEIQAETDPVRREASIASIKLLIEDFIRFLGLPLPLSKEACVREAIASMNEIEHATFKACNIHSLSSKRLLGLLYSQDAFDEFLAYAEDD